MTALVEASRLAVDYRVGDAYVRALDGVDLRVEAQQTLGIVGESGSGKSTLGLTVGRLLPPNAVRQDGDMLVDGRSVFSYSRKELQNLRCKRLGFVFQSPTASLDPTRRVGRQLLDTINMPGGSGADSAWQLLSRVGFSEPKEVASRFPHELSAGMAQRVVMAMAIAHKPALIVADEPTASLDSSVRNHVLDILFGLPREIGAAVILLTHDLRSVASRCSHVAVMYGGRVVEAGFREHVLDAPRHPYTAGLLAATPGSETRGEDLVAIPGIPPVLYGRSTACSFADRCPLASAHCRSIRPEMRDLDGRRVACHRAEHMRSHSEDRPPLTFAAQ
jgi:oligopeptide/dipeptide ABC transporter ATP-binding protein